MVELGYGISYRVLDAQYFGVPQRRRRVFVVGCLGDWRSAAQVLFEPGCLRRDPEKSRKAKSAVADLTATGVGTCGADDNQGQAGHLIATPFAQNQLGEVRVGEVFNTINTNSNASGRNTPMVHISTSTGIASHCLNAGGMGRQDYETETMVVSICEGAHGVTECDIAQTLQSTGGKPGQGYQAIRNSAGVRRLTPRECERLQGFPDDWTLVPHRNKTAADGPRYKAIGNSMAVPVMRWIGERIASAQ
jgi:DNA (cytosine-5)-methyltransferase 1